MSDFRIGWLFPDTLFLHGERGNILALSKYASALGLDNEITKIDFDTEGFDPMDYDVLFAAPGEISVFPEVIEWLSSHKERLEKFVGSGRPLIVTGTSTGIFMDEVIREDGSSFPGLGLIHSAMFERDHVYGDDIYFKCDYAGKELEVLGSMISMADIDIKDEKPFGKILYGYGNTGKDDKEGVSLVNSIFTNALGPVLVTNPWLTVEIVKAAAVAGGKTFEEREIDMSLERKSFELKKRFNLSKKTELTNV